MSHHVQAAKRWKEIEGALLRSQTVAAAGQYAAAIMQEINNPLETICNLSYLLKLEVDDPGRVREYSGQIAEQLTTVIRIAHRTLSFYRPPDTKEAIDLAALAEAALRVHQQKLAAKQAKLLKDIPAGAVVIGHAGDLLQVLSKSSVEFDRRTAAQWEAGDSSSQEQRRSPPGGRRRWAWHSGDHTAEDF
jgi:C4-dicarboxylate-specific signal transduction histidine kinase